MHPESLRITKVISAEQLGALRPALAARGQTLVQCHGCFDIVHPGHIRHLRFAAAQGDRLVISVTADAFVNKGPGRPMFSHDLRAENMAALEFVDWVVVHHAATAAGLLRLVRPDVYIKGAEYATNGDPRFEEERGIVESLGGRVLFSSGDVVFSSTSLVESIRQGADREHGSRPMRAMTARSGP
ncbi:MAG: adenylyltransferase/cytidyltransferase family protein [Phycisphaerales bacterium]